MKTLRTLDELNWAIGVYSNIIKFGQKSILISSSKECISILEEFEEYEKCHDLFERLKSEEKNTQI